MKTSQQAHDRTRTFARVLGPFLVIVCVTAVLRTSNMRTLVSEFTASSLWAWVAGAFVLLGGLVIVALHQYWRGVAAVIVSALGWLVVLRGVFLLAFPDTFASLADNMIGAEAWWKAICIVFALIGLYLIYVGWMPEAGRPTSAADKIRHLDKGESGDREPEAHQDPVP
jgi:hypothetical protein